ncbi:hypothetical protein [Salininema proteolyticum]|uniref:Uncharacterized protein n=1 Tax=Salininema proteolyticum TaxID=1607685 RepID=A0ABV8U3X8_9ACTN
MVTERHAAMLSHGAGRPASMEATIGRFDQGGRRFTMTFTFDDPGRLKLYEERADEVDRLVLTVTDPYDENPVESWRVYVGQVPSDRDELRRLAFECFRGDSRCCIDVVGT